MKTRIAPGLVPAALLAAFLTLPAHAESMHHRHTEHALEGYLIGGLTWSMGGVSDVSGVHVGSAYLQPQAGLGFEFPMNPHACLGIAGLGFELVAGPALPLGLDLPYDVQVRPGVFLEFSGDIPLQLFLRMSAILRSIQNTDPGVETALLLGWHARPISLRLGFTWEAYPERGGTLGGVRLELLWVGRDPQPD